MSGVHLLLFELLVTLTSGIYIYLFPLNIFPGLSGIDLFKYDVILFLPNLWQTTGNNLILANNDKINKKEIKWK